MADQSAADRELQEDRDAAVGKGVGGADSSGTGNILASAQRQNDDDDSSSAGGEDEGSSSTDGNDEHLKDDQKAAN